jgi:hypothetical protein
MLQPYHPPYSPDLSPPDYFLFPKLKMKLKRLHFADVAEIQEAVTDELKKVPKEEFSAALQKLYDCAKSCIYASGIFGLNKGMCLPHMSSICKKFSPKIFGPHRVEFTGFCSRVTFDWLRLFILHKHAEILLLLSIVCKGDIF